MKHLLDIKYFLTEALPLEFQNQYKPYFINRPKEVQARLNNLLDNQERIYIPYNSDTISETQLNVKIYLEDLGYKIMDYKLNSAVQIENSKRTIRISKLLAKNPELLKDFTLDDTRANTRTSSEFSIVLTSNYQDVAGMSFERCWTNSCLNIQSGVNKKYVKDEVQQGTIVAYLIKGNDLEIEEPLGRVNIKPFYSLRDKNEILYVVDRRVYGNVPDEKLFIDKIYEYLKEKQEVKLVGFYNKVKGLYSDAGSPDEVSIGKDYNIGYARKYDDEGYDRKGYDVEGFDREGLDKKGLSKDGDYPYKEHLTREQYHWLKRNIKCKFNVDKNGLVNVTGRCDVNINNQNLTQIPVKFGVVKGYFSCSNNNLTSLEGAPSWCSDFNCSYNPNLTNLEGAPSIVRGWFDCSNNPNLTSLVGAPSKVWEFYCSNTGITSLEGSPREVTGGFWCPNNPNLTSLVGAPIRVVGYFDCSGNNLTSLVGVGGVGGSFFCRNNNLTSLVGAPREVRGGFYCDNNNLTSLVGAPSEVREGFHCKEQKNGHIFTKEDVIKVSQVGGFSYL